MKLRAAWIFAGVAVCGGCGSLDATGLGATDEIMDAPQSDAIAVDAFVDVAAPDTAEPADSTDVLADAFDADAMEAEVEAGPPPFCDNTNPNLIGCYRFEDTEHPTQPRDDSMYGHHGTSSGVSFIAGKAGRAIVINGTSLTNVPDKTTLAVTSAITIEAWINPKTLPTTGRVGIVDNNGRYGLFILAGGVLRATAPGAIDSPVLLATTGWQHVAYTYDGTTQRLYINGTQVKETALAGGTYGPGDGAGLALGMNSPNGDQLDGALDAVRIWRVARTAMQICRAAGTC